VDVGPARSVGIVERDPSKTRLKLFRLY